MPADKVGDLFTKFSRLHPPGEQQRGTGLGLSIVKAIVDSYHGRVDVKSSLGEGSTFTIWLPSSAQLHEAGGSDTA